jgi:hypothetical protein
MPPKKKLGKKIPTESSSQVAGGQVPITPQTTTQTMHISQIAHPQTSIEPHPTIKETRRPSGTTNNPGRGARHEHLYVEHSAAILAPRDRSSRGSAIGFRRGD